ncbi:MAG: ABC transporter ATP-binding protein [Nitrospira bacterium SM23_35]|jgi:Fe-S cluster assembly scaffold protein SufB|nr:MAG: ABC transporter ATP-binding protein [Nitrospira bacterium SM23_35]
MPVRESYLLEIREKAENAKDKKAAIGPDIDLSRYTQHIERGKIESLESLAMQAKEAAIMTGISLEEEQRAGSFLQVDQSVVYESLNKAYEGQLEIMSTTDALTRYDWLEEYFWKSVPVDQDKYTAQAALNMTHGYFIRVFPHQKPEYPVQSCLLVAENYISQNVHNIIVVEEGAELQVITGCTLSKNDAEGIHLGISEFYVKKGGKLFFTMIHNWADNFHVRPRTWVVVEEDGAFVSNYVLLKPVKSIQAFPVAHLKGDRASAKFNTVVYGLKDSYIDLGSRIILEGKETRGESIARTIAADESVIYSRGDLIAKTKDHCVAHLDCRGIVFSPKADIYAIPQLISHGALKAELSHEASIGPIAEEQVEYLMSRGISKEDAISVITSGFLNLDIPYIPEFLDKNIKEVIQVTSREAL